MDKKFTISDLKREHVLFIKQRVLRYLDKGEKVIRILDGKKLPRIEGTNAEVIPLSREIGFIEYLEKKYGTQRT